MGQDPEALRREIAGTRADLGGTIDAIEDRVSPGRIMERRKNRFVEGVQSTRDRVMGVADGVTSQVTGAPGNATDAVAQRTQGTPIVAGALAFGVGFLVAAAFPPSQIEKDASSRLLDEAEPLKQELSAVGHDVADKLKEPAKDAAQSIKDTATDAAQGVGDAAKGAVDDTKQQAQDSASTVRSATPDRP